MIEVKVPKDILVYETKFVGPLTAKQLVCAVVAVLIDFMLYNLVLEPLHVSQEALFYIIALIDVPIFALSMKNPMGIPMKDYIRLFTTYTLAAPRKRKNYTEFTKKEQLSDKEKKKIKKSKVHKAYQ